MGVGSTPNCDLQVFNAATPTTSFGMEAGNYPYMHWYNGGRDCYIRNAYYDMEFGLTGASIDYAFLSPSTYSPANKVWLQLVFRTRSGWLGLGPLDYPNSAFHQDMGNATANYHKFTAGTTTGVAATDGFDVGIDASGNAELRQRENLPIYIYVNNTLAMTINADGSVTNVGNITAPTIKLTTGATNNYVLKSDASGNANWVDPATMGFSGYSGFTGFTGASGYSGFGTNILYSGFSGYSYSYLFPLVISGVSGFVPFYKF
jgi:hypothetical protein